MKFLTEHDIEKMKELRDADAKNLELRKKRHNPKRKNVKPHSSLPKYVCKLCPKHFLSVRALDIHEWRDHGLPFYLSEDD